MRKYRTPAEDILLSVQQWYHSKGFYVPADELKVCKDDIENERIQNEYNSAVMLKRTLEFQFQYMKEEDKNISYEKSAEFIQRIADATKIIESVPIADRPKEIAPAKASYGTPEFWKDYWVKKKAGGWVATSKK
jgi:hypothetical protein